MASAVTPTKVLAAFKQAGKEPYLHQLDLVSDLLLLPRFKVLLADDVGLGKTIETLAYVKLGVESGRLAKVLIVVPAALLDQWLDELRKFGFTDEEVYVAREAVLAPGRPIYVVTMDRAKKDEYLKLLEQVPWDLVVIDEAHKLRLDTQRLRLKTLCEKAKSCLLLTATPHTGDEKSYAILRGTVDKVVRREKRDVEEYEMRKIFPNIRYYIVRVKATQEEAKALREIIRLLEEAEVEPIVRYVVLKRALSSPLSLITTLNKVVGGTCTEEDLEEGELDGCLSHVQDLLKNVKAYTAEDRKLSALKRVLNGPLAGRKTIVFTEYATTAQYLFQALAENCDAEWGEGFGKAYCKDGAVMYTTHKARVELGDAINREIEELAAKPRPVLITTDIFTEGVNLQMFDAVVNYEVVWSPTKHVQRIGRVWRLGQKSQDVAVVDMALDAPGTRSEFEMYVEYLDKIYQINLTALTPHAYAEYEIYEFKGELEEKIKVKISDLGGVYIPTSDAIAAIFEKRLEELREKVEKLLQLKEALRGAKDREKLLKDLKAKLGWPPEKSPEPGGGYYKAKLVVEVGGLPALEENLLARLDTPLSKTRQVKGDVVYREVELSGVEIQGEPGEIRQDEKKKIEQAALKFFADHLWTYAKQLIGDPRLRDSVRLRIQVEERAIVTTSVSLDDFDAAVEEALKRSDYRTKTEHTAVKCIKEYLVKQGYRIVRDYDSAPRPFDMVVEKGGKRYTVECKGRYIRPGEALSVTLTANEMDWGSKYPDRHLICVATVEGTRCNTVECYTFDQFLKTWKVATKRGLDYVVEAVKESVDKERQ
ncbi:DEAD/DEAH box helicase [Pyrobaculum calidifontis]|uniref:Helicase domain protein n=1 Tax=Pyrobaculum calidifontis (strain DSM 21063 / JCM 11548 / VA1) TaxID=410359 RepID=A3MU25_PYRCJ|nr:DEAD/DEAH box helicase [Pyrobaculum calidifontis]ABO08142.1 helicase domain protein [Pyrobaculum calidifontis JCM 11548]